MIFFVLGRSLSILLDGIAVTRRSEHEQDLEFLLRRHQLRILQRKQPRPPRLCLWDKLGLAVLAAKLVDRRSGRRQRLSLAVLLFKPNTRLKWHRELVRSKWTRSSRGTGGRPPIASDLEALIVRLAKGNPRWGYAKIEGELGKLGDDVGRTPIRDVLKRRHVPPVPERAKRGGSWRTFLGHDQDQVLACDFFTVETAWLKPLYVLFFL